MRELTSQEMTVVTGAGVFTEVLEGGLIGITVAAMIVAQAPEEVLPFASTLIISGGLIGAGLPILKMLAKYADISFESYMQNA